MNLQHRLFETPNPLRSYFFEQGFEKLPEKPGVFLVKDQVGNVLFVGRAKNLRQSLESFCLTNISDFPFRRRKLIALASSMEWSSSLTNSAAQLRQSIMLEKHAPPFNSISLAQARFCYVDVRADQKGVALRVSDHEKDENVWRFGAYRGATCTKQAIQAMARLIRVMGKNRMEEADFLFEPVLVKKTVGKDLWIEVLGDKNGLQRTDLARGIIGFLSGASDGLLDDIARELLLRPDLSGFLYRTIENDLRCLQKFYASGPKRTKELMAKSRSRSAYLPIKDLVRLHTLYA